MSRRRPRYGKVGVVAKPTGPGARQAVRQVIEALQRHGAACILDEDAARLAGQPPGTDRARLTREAEAIVVLGGDGTFLSVARSVGAKGPPLMGVNLGSLGFLTEVNRSEIEAAIETVMQGKSVEERRLMLQVTIRRNSRKSAVYRALNDVVVAKSALARLIRLQVEVNEQPVSRYRSDGLIVCTPTGSTAYSLSAGGPLVHPGLNGILVTPICPHALVNRPLVVPPDARITVRRLSTARRLSKEEQVYLTVDGQVGGPLEPGDRLEVKRNSFPLRLLRPFSRTFYDTLRSKLKWR